MKKTEEMYKKIYIKSDDDLSQLQWGESYTIKMRSGDIFEKMGYNQMQNKSWWKNNVDWYLQPQEQEPLKKFSLLEESETITSSDTIERYIKTQAHDLTDEEWLKLPKEEILQLYKNCYKLLQFYAIQEHLPTDSYPDTEADGFVFCGKCGKMK